MSINSTVPGIASVECTDETKTEVPGLIVLDHRGEPIFLNSAVEEILCFATSKMDLRSVIQQRVRSELNLQNGCGERVFLLSSGRRHYVCWVSALESFSGHAQNKSIAVVLTRSSRAIEDLRSTCEQYKLTPREREAVLLLRKGLTSKEIARRMDISAHTVKALLHLIMLKLGVTTRSGIVGRINSRMAEDLPNKLPGTSEHI